MAGEIEEPFRFNFQADLLHSGSISFGRFESESLSWERRSSFSHNRYLEEVEKYSKPGSVTEKKAYFEAHFRRKALLKQSSSECQDGREFNTSENDDPHDLEESENGNESKHFTCFDESPQSSGHFKFDEETEVQKYENENVKRFYVDSGNASSHVSSGYLKEGIIQKSEGDEAGLLSAAPKDEFITNTVNHLVTASDHFKLKETCQSRTEDAGLVKSEENTRENVNNMVVTVDVVSEPNDSPLASNTADKDDDSASSGPQQTFSPMVKPTSEMKRAKPKLKPHANVSTRSKTRESEGLLMKEKEKKPLRPPSPITRAGRKTSNSEESSTSFSKAKILPPKKSNVKEYKLEKTVEAKTSVSEKSLPGASQTANRTKQTINPSKPQINQVAAGFSFKSDQRAEKRKEEKKTAEMAQVRKSLNFKATPMPSFYNESARSSNRNKVTSTSKTSKKPPTPSDPRPSSSSTNRICPSVPPRKCYMAQKTVQKDAGSQKHKEPEPVKGPQSRGTPRKDMGRVGYLAVSLAT